MCALQWNRHERELLSSHGFSQNQLCLWRYPSMTKVRASAPRSPAAPCSPLQACDTISQPQHIVE